MENCQSEFQNFLRTVEFVELSKTEHTQGDVTFWECADVKRNGIEYGLDYMKHSGTFKIKDQFSMSVKHEVHERVHHLKNLESTAEFLCRRGFRVPDVLKSE
jgi:hypothetical protein